MGFIKNILQDLNPGVLSKISILDASMADGLVKTIEEKYCDGQRSKAMWERLRDTRSLNNSEGWRYVSSIPYAGPLLLFVEPSDDKTMLSMASGTDIEEFLAESPGFVFYITDTEASFLICFNDHDYLIGTGAAKDWIGSLPS